MVTTIVSSGGRKRCCRRWPPVEVGLIVAAAWMVSDSEWQMASPTERWLDRVQGVRLGLFWIAWGIVEVVAPWGFLEKDSYIKM